jgi:hypothetical protein
VDNAALRAIAIALLCLGVIAVASATLDSTVRVGPGTGSGAGPAREDTGDGLFPVRNDSENGSAKPAGENASSEPLRFEWPCLRGLTNPFVTGGLLFGVLAVGAVGAWRRTRLFGLAAFLFLSIPGFILYSLLTACERTTLVRRSLPGAGLNGTAGLSGGGGALADPSVPMGFLVLGGLFVGALGVALWASGDRSGTVEGDDAPPDVEEEPTGADVEAVGRAAGRAADRIEASDSFENEVYRAWAEMTRPIDVAHPRSSTPAEFASAAVEAGMDSADVDRLTTLFEAVRYGGREPTPERERTAIETLRRIEAQYAGEDANATGADDDGNGNEPPAVDGGDPE